MTVHTVMVVLFIIAKSLAMLKFSPADYVEFVNCPVMIPRQKMFTIINKYDREVSVSSVVSESSNFHTVKFQPALLQPREKVKIQILFLPYYAEIVESFLKINTSEGEVQYAVIGRAIANPYRLQPYLGQRLQHGTKAFQHPLVMYNPYRNPLYITEVFTTEAFITLNGPLIKSTESTVLGSVENSFTAIETNTAHWTIEPGEEKEIIILSMTAPANGKSTGYVHIKTSIDNIVLPVEVLVLESAQDALKGRDEKEYVDSIVPPEETIVDDNIRHTLRSREDTIDFGVLTGIGQKSFVDLWLQNTGTKDVEILDIVVENQDQVLTVIPIARKVLAERGTEFLVAQLIFTAESTSAAQIEESVPKGKNNILLLTDSPNPAHAVLAVPYVVSVLLGGIVLSDEAKTGQMQNAFVLPSLRNDESLAPAESPSNPLNVDDGIIYRDFYLRNSFALPIRLLTVSTSSCGGTFGFKADFLDSNGSSTVCQIVETQTQAPTPEVTSPNNGTVSESAPLQEVMCEFSPLAVADSGKKWPPITVMFFKNIAAERSKADALAGLAGLAGGFPPASRQHTPGQASVMPYTCWLEIWSNKSSHRFPLHVVDGSVQLSYMDAVPAKLDSDPTVVAQSSCIEENPEIGRLNEGMSLQSDFTVSEGSEFAYKIDMGVISASEPRPLKISLSNYNTVRMPLYLSSADRAVCVCEDVSWPIGRNDDVLARQHVTDMLYRRTLLADEHEEKKCFCHSGQEEGSEEQGGSDAKCTRFELRNTRADLASLQWEEGLEDNEELFQDDLFSSIDELEVEVEAESESSGAVGSIAGDGGVGDAELRQLQTAYGFVNLKIGSGNDELKNLRTERDKLKATLNNLIEMRKKLLSNKDSIEEDLLMGRLEVMGMEGEFEDGDSFVSADDLILAAKKLSNNGSSGKKMRGRERIRYIKQATPLGRPLRSLGLLYECGRVAIGVARAGYNSLFRIHLNATSLMKRTLGSGFDLESEGLRSDHTTLQLSTPYRDVSLSLHYRLTLDKMISHTTSNDLQGKFPSFLMGGGDFGSIYITTTLVSGPLQEYWLKLISDKKHQIAIEKEKKEAIKAAKATALFLEGGMSEQCHYVSPVVEIEEEETEKLEESVKIVISSDKYFLTVSQTRKENDTESSEVGNRDASLTWSTALTPLSVCNLLTPSDQQAASAVPYAAHTQYVLPLPTLFEYTQDSPESISQKRDAINSILADPLASPLPSLMDCKRKILQSLPTHSASDRERREELLAVMDSYLKLLRKGHVFRAHKQQLLLEDQWLKNFPEGVLVPPVDILTHAPGTLHRHTIQGMSIQSPLAHCPLVNEISLPPIRPNEIMVFYIKVKNVFNVPVSFTVKIFKDSDRIDSNQEEKSEERILQSDTDTWHEWFQEKCYFKGQPNGDNKDINENCPLTYKNMRDTNLLLNWYRDDEGAPPRVFSPSRPEYSEHEKLRRSQASNISDELNVKNYAIIEGVETTSFSDRRSYDILDGAESSVFLVHPSAEFLSKYGKEENPLNWGEAVLPQASYLLGPIIFLPPHSKKTPSQIETFHKTLYVVNSFSGLDKILITGQTDSPSVNIKTVAVVSKVPTPLSSSLSFSSSSRTGESLLNGRDTVTETETDNNTNTQPFQLVYQYQNIQIYNTVEGLPPCLGATVAVDSPDDRIVITLYNEALVDTTVVQVAWDDEFCSDISPTWLTSWHRNYLKKVVSFMCDDVHLPRVLAATPGASAFTSNGKTRYYTKNTNTNGSNDWEISFSTLNFLGNCKYDRRNSILALYIQTDTLGQVSPRSPVALLFHFRAYLSQDRKTQCFNSIPGVPIWGVSEKGEDVELWLFSALFILTFLYGVNTLISLLIARGKQAKKRNAIMALIKRDADNALLATDKQNKDSDIPPVLGTFDPRVSLPPMSLAPTQRGFLYPVGVNLSDIRTDPGVLPRTILPLHLTQVEALKARRLRFKEDPAPASALKILVTESIVKPVAPDGIPKRIRPTSAVSTVKRSQPVTVTCLKKPDRTPPAVPAKPVLAPVIPAVMVSPVKLVEPVAEFNIKRSTLTVIVDKTPEKEEEKGEERDEKKHKWREMAINEMVKTRENDEVMEIEREAEKEAEREAEKEAEREAEMEAEREAEMEEEMDAEMEEEKEAEKEEKREDQNEIQEEVEEVEEEEVEEGVPHTASWGSMDDTDHDVCGVVERADSESKIRILEDLSWASTSSPLRNDDMFSTAFPVARPCPSFTLPQLLSLESTDTEKLAPFSPSAAPFPSDLFASSDSFGTSDNFSTKMFPSENNISGDIATELLSRDELEETHSWEDDLTDFKLETVFRGDLCVLLERAPPGFNSVNESIINNMDINKSSDDIYNNNNMNNIANMNNNFLNIDTLLTINDGNRMNINNIGNILDINPHTKMKSPHNKNLSHPLILPVTPPPGIDININMINSLQSNLSQGLVNISVHSNDSSISSRNTSPINPSKRAPVNNPNNIDINNLTDMYSTNNTTNINNINSLNINTISTLNSHGNRNTPNLSPLRGGQFHATQSSLNALNLNTFSTVMHPPINPGTSTNISTNTYTDHKNNLFHPTHASHTHNARNNMDYLNNLDTSNITNTGTGAGDLTGAYFSDREPYPESDTWLRRLSLPSQSVGSFRSNYSQFDSPQNSQFEGSQVSQFEDSQSSQYSMGSGIGLRRSVAGVGGAIGMGVGVSRSNLGSSVMRRHSMPAHTAFFHNSEENEIEENDDWLQDLISSRVQVPGYNPESEIQDRTLDRNRGGPMAMGVNMTARSEYSTYANQVAGTYGERHSTYDDPLSYELQHHLQLQHQLQHQQLLEQRQLQQEFHLQQHQLQLEQQQLQQHQHQQQHLLVRQQQQQQQQQQQKHKTPLAPPPGFEAR